MGTQKTTIMRTLIIAALFLCGCASSGVTTGPSFTDWDSGRHRQHVKVSFDDPNALNPSTTTTILLECSYPYSELLKEGKTEEEILSESKCRNANTGSHASETGYMSGVGSAFVGAAGNVGAGYLIGKGLSDSGDSSTYEDSSNYSESYEMRDPAYYFNGYPDQ